MVGEFTGVGTLNCIYFILFAVGVGYAIIAGVMGGLSQIDVPGVDLDIPGVELEPGEPDIHLELPFDHDISHNVDHPEVGFSPLSPITIATFITAFGGVGLITNNLTALSPIWGLLISSASGLAISGMMYVFYGRVLGATQSSSQVRQGETIGKTAEVVAPIPAGEVGAVAFIARGTRVQSPARSADGTAIPRGTLVKIVAETGRVVAVRRQEEDADS